MIHISELIRYSCRMNDLIKAMLVLGLVLVACDTRTPASRDSGQSVDSGGTAGGGHYAACSTDSDCSGSLTCERAFSGEPQFCTERCGSTAQCRDIFGPDAICQSTDFGGLCTLSCDVAGGCPPPSACRGVACQVF